MKQHDHYLHLNNSIKQSSYEVISKISDVAIHQVKERKLVKDNKQHLTKIKRRVTQILIKKEHLEDNLSKINSDN